MTPLLVWFFFFRNSQLFSTTIFHTFTTSLQTQWPPFDVFTSLTFRNLYSAVKQFSDHVGWGGVFEHLFEARRHAPATGLHDAIIAAHVLADLPVLFTPLLSAGQHCRVTEERRNTVTGQSANSGEGRRGREKERSVSSLASQQQEMKRWKDEERKENKAGAVVISTRSAKLYCSSSAGDVFWYTELKSMKYLDRTCLQILMWKRLDCAITTKGFTV